MLSWPGSRLQAPGSGLQVWRRGENKCGELSHTDSASADPLRWVDIIFLGRDWVVFGVLEFTINFSNFILTVVASLWLKHWRSKSWAGGM